MAQFYEDILGITSVKSGGNWYGFSESTTQLAVEPESGREDNVAKYEANWQNPYLLQVQVESEDEMREILARAKKNNIKVLAEFEKHSFGTLSKLLDPDSNFIELILE